MNQASVTEKTVKVFNHMLNAHRVWNNRITPLKQSFAVWELHKPDSWITICNENHLQTLQILESHDLNVIINYANTKGETFSNSIRDILFQVVNHSTYHRGQIAMEFRHAGITPLLTDYIFYKR